MGTINKLVFAYKIFNEYDFISFNTAMIRWKQHYNHKAELYVICDEHTKETLEKTSHYPYKDSINIILYQPDYKEIEKKAPKMKKTALLNEEIMFLWNMFNEPFLFLSDDKFPICDINDDFLNKEYKILGYYPKWKPNKDNYWQLMVQKGAEFISKEYNVKNPKIFKNHYFPLITKEFVEWFKPYIYKYGYAQMITYYELYVTKRKTLKDIFKKDMIWTTREFGKRRPLNKNKICKDVYGLNVSDPKEEIKLLNELLESSVLFK